MHALVHSGPAAPPEATTDSGQYLTFLLAGGTFALPILHIREIIEFGTLAVVPTMPAFIRGVINLRGAVVPVLDLSSRFGRGLAEVTRRTCIVILDVPLPARAGTASQVFGVVVDAVNEVVDIPHADIEPAPTFGTWVRSEFIEGMGRLDGRFVILLDAGSLLSDSERERLDGVPALAQEPATCAITR